MPGRHGGGLLSTNGHFFIGVFPYRGYPVSRTLVNKGLDPACRTLVIKGLDPVCRTLVIKGLDPVCRTLMIKGLDPA